MELKRIQKKLENAGYVTDLITVYNINGNGNSAPALRVNTDYEGPYPTKEVFNSIEAIKKIAKKHRTECRGYYTAVFIY